jgi:hypothetical protein
MGKKRNIRQEQDSKEIEMIVVQRLKEEKRGALECVKVCKCERKREREGEREGERLTVVTTMVMKKVTPSSEGGLTKTVTTNRSPAL